MPEKNIVDIYRDVLKNNDRYLFDWEADAGATPGSMFAMGTAANMVQIFNGVLDWDGASWCQLINSFSMDSSLSLIHIYKTFNGALYKAFEGAGVELPKYKQMIMTVKDADKPEAVGVAKRFEKLGYKIYATRSTAKYLQEHGVNALRVNKISQESPNVMDLILGHKIDLVIDTPTQGNGDKTRDGFLIRRNAIETRCV